MSLMDLTDRELKAFIRNPNAFLTAAYKEPCKEGSFENSNFYKIFDLKDDQIRERVERVRDEIWRDELT